MTNLSNLLPEGFHDALPPFAEAEAAAERQVLDVFASHGYARVTPPLAEYEDTLTSRMLGASKSDLMRFVDPISQRTLAMRPDITMQVGRIAGTSLSAAPRPLRLSYAGQVLKLRSGQLHPERSRLQIGAELIGDNSVAAAGEIVSVALEALEKAGARDITVDFTMPDVVDILSAGPLPLNSAQAAEVRRELDMKDAGGLTALGATGYLPLIEATGPLEQAIERMRRFDEKGLLSTRLDGIASIAKNVKNHAAVTLDPTERHGFGYQSWMGFTLYADGIPHALGRGGTYQIAHDNAEPENAVGVSLYPGALLSGGENESRKKLFLSLHHDTEKARELRADGWRTVAALTEKCDAAALGCTHRLDGKMPVKI